MKGISAFLNAIFSSFKDLLPIIVVIGFFQLVVLQQPLPDAFSIFFGLILVVLGLTLFVFGLDMALFPLGESMAHALARKGSVFWLMVFSFLLGFGTTIAEPALTAVASKAAEVAGEGGIIEISQKAQDEYSIGLRLTVAVSVGFALMLGVLRILKGWPIHRFIIGGYILVVLMTPLAPQYIIGVAYDSGGVTTSTITVPLVTALGVGLATVIKGRNPMQDGFGLIAFASLAPILFVMFYGIFIR